MRILAREANVPALGYVVAYRALQHALDERLAASDVRVEHETQALRLVRGPSAIEVHTTTRGEPRIVPARLVAIADGSGDLAPQFARHRHDYRQVALVAKAWMREPHHGIAFERFTPEGPMALLPEPDRYGVVWTTTPAHGTTLLDMSDVEFIRELTSRFGPRVPPFVHIAERRVFPLALEFAYRVAAERVVMLGNAAQSLHPVAGQGFNLGVRDAYGLARDLLCSEPNQFGTPAQLERYARSRRADRIAGAAFTHSILSIFGSASPVASWPRGALVAMLDATPVVKRMFTRSMLFGLK
jgi:2-octaprenyl-6-methoxyphenol hydroxylase